MGEPLLPIIAEISIARADRAGLGTCWWEKRRCRNGLARSTYRPDVGATFFMQQDSEKQAARDTEGGDLVRGAIDAEAAQVQLLLVCAWHA